MNKIIINADDFGLKPSVNSAIIELFKNGVINSTTLMSNMPSFGDAVELAYKNHITDRIGIHLNLEKGHLLTTDIQSVELFKRENKFGFKGKRNNLFLLSKNEEYLIYKEFSAQIERIKNAGISITHIDTHHHIHEIFSITMIVIALLRKYNIPSMRILNNLIPNTKLYKFVYRKSVNWYIRIKNANYSDFFGNQLHAISQLKINRDYIINQKLEIMVHPDFNKQGVIIDRIEDQMYSFDFLTNISDYYYE
jgi:chitin disaccharide deacetylase